MIDELTEAVYALENLINAYDREATATRAHGLPVDRNADWMSAACRKLRNYIAADLADALAQARRDREDAEYAAGEE